MAETASRRPADRPHPADRPRSTVARPALLPGRAGRPPDWPSRYSHLAHRNPSVKLLAVVLVALALTFIYDPVTPTVIFILTLLCGWLLGGLGPRALLRPLWVFVIAGVAILLANIFFNKENAVSAALFYLGPVKVTGPALWAAGTLWVRLLCFALLSVVFVKTTEPQRLLLSLVHQLHLNYRVAYGTMVGYRMLPLFQSDYQTIRAAQRVRGVREGRRSFRPWPRWRRYAVPLLAGAVRRAGRVAVAMDARAFGALPGRSYRERVVVRRSDWLSLLAVVAIVGAVVTGLWWAGITRFTLE
jgi:energy-coupling factor transport system permease protein